MTLTAMLPRAVATRLLESTERAFCSCLCPGCNPPGGKTVVHCRNKSTGCG